MERTALIAERYYFFQNGLTKKRRSEHKLPDRLLNVHYMG